ALGGPGADRERQARLSSSRGTASPSATRACGSRIRASGTFRVREHESARAGRSAPCSPPAAMPSHATPRSSVAPSACTRSSPHGSGGSRELTVNAETSEKTSHTGPLKALRRNGADVPRVTARSASGDRYESRTDPPTLILRQAQDER